MSQAAAALRAAAAALLTAQGERDLAGMVEAAEVEVLPSERWSMGARTVSAHRLTLAVDARTFVVLRADAAQLGKIRSAFEAAVRSPESELADLALLLRLPAIGTSWQRAYREAPPAESSERPSPDAVLRGATALLVEAHDPEAADILSRATLESADVPASVSGPLIRYVLRLDPADLVHAERRPDVAEALRWAVHGAGLRASERIASVDLAAALVDRPRHASGPEALLRRALAARGIPCLTLSRDEGSVTLAIAVEGELRLVRIDPEGRGIVRGQTDVTSFDLGVDALDGDEAAHEIAAELCSPG